MKILILVLSYKEAVFKDFLFVQKNTWDAIPHSNIDVVYYMGGNNGWHNQELSVNCSDDYEMMHWKFKLALDQIDYHKYDLIFRTNSCAYIVNDKLLEIAKTLPKTQCYAGYHNGGYISGAGIFFSPDVLDILRDELTDMPHGAEDVLIGHILNGKVPMTAENSRIDADLEGFHSFDGYHFRAKTSNDNNDRVRDVNFLVALHNKLNDKAI